MKLPSRPQALDSPIRRWLFYDEQIELILTALRWYYSTAKLESLEKSSVRIFGRQVRQMLDYLKTTGGTEENGEGTAE